MHFPRIASLAAVLAAFGSADVSARPQMNVRAQNLSKLLGPSALNEKSGSAGDMSAIRKRVIPILNQLQDSYKTSGPTPESLIVNAYAMRKDVGPYEKMVTRQRLIQAWKDAEALGLFDANGTYSDRIVKGRFVGEAVVFEHVVPPDIYPAGSTHLSNFRIVEPERKRSEGADLTLREQAFQGQLVKVVSEIASGKRLAEVENGPKMNAIGQTDKQAKEIWMKEVELAGEAYNEMPNIRVDARVTATPSHMSKERWRVSAEVNNFSSHPTSIEVEYWLIGITDKKRDHYIMAKGKEKMELRKGEVRDIELFTKAKNSYKGKADDHDELSKIERARSRVRMRGFVIRVNHGKGLASTMSSDRHLDGYVDPDDPLDPAKLPQF